MNNSLNRLGTAGIVTLVVASGGAAALAKEKDAPDPAAILAGCEEQRKNAAQAINQVRENTVYLAHLNATFQGPVEFPVTPQTSPRSVDVGDLKNVRRKMKMISVLPNV